MAHAYPIRYTPLRALAALARTEAVLNVLNSPGLKTIEAVFFGLERVVSPFVDYDPAYISKLPQ